MRNFPDFFWDVLRIRFVDLTMKPAAFYKITWQSMKVNKITEYQIKALRNGRR